MLAKRLTAVRASWWLAFKSMKNEFGGYKNGVVEKMLDPKNEKNMHKMLVKSLFKNKVCPVPCSLMFFSFSNRIVVCVFALLQFKNFIGITSSADLRKKINLTDEVVGLEAIEDRTKGMPPPRPPHPSTPLSPLPAPI